MDLPEGVSPEMVEALKRGEDVRMPDGSPVRMFRPFAGDEYGEWSVVIVREQVGLPSVRLSPDYGALSPLWPSSDKTDAMVPKELLTRLIGWQQEFESNFHWETGWQSDVPVDDGPRRRTLDADQEILDTCRELQSGGQGVTLVTLVTDDTGMTLRATAQGLRVIAMPEAYLRRKPQTENEDP